MSGFMRHTILGDGNCQFAAVAFVVGDDAASARQKAVDWIRDHLEDYRDGILNSLVPDPDRPNAYDDMAEVRAVKHREERLKAFLNRMRRDGIWGDQNTLQALSEVYGPIDVFDSETRRKTLIRPLHGSGNNGNMDPVSLRYDGNHYEALVPTPCSTQTSQPSESHEDRGSRKQCGKPGKP